jgi:hypothetical protein
MDRRFQPRAPRFGTNISHVEAGNASTLSPAPGASATTIYKIATPYTKCFVDRATVQMGTLPTGSAAVTGQLFIRNAGTSRNDAITSAQDLKTGGGIVINVTFPLVFPTTVTDAQRTLQQGDYLALDIVYAGTNTQSPVDFWVTVELCILQ